MMCVELSSSGNLRMLTVAAGSILPVDKRVANSGPLSAPHVLKRNKKEEEGEVDTFRMTDKGG